MSRRGLDRRIEDHLRLDIQPSRQVIRRLFEPSLEDRPPCGLERFPADGEAGLGLEKVGPGELLQRFRYGRDVRFLIYMMLMQVGVQVAQPFFAPFIREGLRFSYIDYLMLVGAAFVARAVFQPFWLRQATPPPSVQSPPS